MLHILLQRILFTAREFLVDTRVQGTSVCASAADALVLEHQIHIRLGLRTGLQLPTDGAARLTSGLVGLASHLIQILATVPDGFLSGIARQNLGHVPQPRDSHQDEQEKYIVC